MTETDEQVEVPNLKSGTDEWKRQMAARLEKESAARRRGLRMPQLRKWPLAVAATLLITILAGTSSPSMLWLLARSSSRTFEFRVSGMAYERPDEQRGAADTETSPFLFAKLILAIRTKIGLDGTSWQHVRGRAALLENGGSARIESAIETLSQVHEANPQDPVIANDLAVALLLRAASDQGAVQARTEDVARALEALRNGLRGTQDASLYFNLGLAYERLQTYNEALEAWQEFLKLEPTGGWADEAKEHIQRIEARKRARVAAGAQPAEDLVLDLAAQGFRSTDRFDAFRMADDLAAQGDKWLQDLLLENRQVKGKTLDLLARAADELLKNRRDSAEPLLREAIAALSGARKPATFVFALYELAFALQRSATAQECMATADRALRNIPPDYRWLEIHLRVTLGLCQGMTRDFESSYASVERARAITNPRFPGRELYVLGMESGILREVGSYREALPLDFRAIEKYWEGIGGPRDAYQSYMGLSTSLAGLRYPQAALAALSEAVQISASSRNRTTEAVVRARYGEMLADADLIKDAQREFDSSEALFDKHPPADRLSEVSARLSKARFDGQRGKLKEGLDVIARMARFMGLDGMGVEAKPVRQNPAVETQFWYVKADLLARSDDLNGSEESLKRLVALGEAARASMPLVADRSAVARRVSQGVSLLTERHLSQGRPGEAWRIWTENSQPFVTVGKDSAIARVIYAVLPSGPVALVSNATGVHSAKLPPIAEISRIIRELRPLLATPDSSLTRVRMLSRRLGSMLVDPLDDYLKNDRVLYISATEPFSEITFASLVTSDDAWLADRYQIVYSPPIGGAGKMGKAAAVTRDMKLLAVGYGESSEILGNRLPALSADVDRDLKASAEAFDDDPSTLSGNGAHLAAVIEKLESAEVFQFSGHALTLGDDTALILAPGGGADVSGRLLWASRLSASALGNLKLAVLAACSTGRPSDSNHSPSSDMARSFLIAGVPLVLASSWDVNSKATTELIRHFYEGISHPRQRSPEEATAEAAAVLRHTEGFAHPYYWAAFALYRR